MTPAGGGEERFRLDGNSAAGPLQEVFASEMTTASCTCASCSRVSALGALHMYGGLAGCVLRCPSCEAIVLCVTTVPAGHVIEMRGVLRIFSR
jgi:hypothetical protein